MTDIDYKGVTKFFERSLNTLPKPYQSGLSNHLSLTYFTVSGLDLLKRQDIIEKEKQNIIDFIYSRQILPSKTNPDVNREYCGFRGANFVGQPYCVNKSHFSVDGETPSTYDFPNLANTYCALMILRIAGDDFSSVNKKAIIDALKCRSQENGSFNSAPKSTESDVRFIFMACAISYMLNDWSAVDIEKTTQFIMDSLSYEFAFGQSPEQEAHGGSTYCAVNSLALMKKLHLILPFKDKFIRWLVNKQITGFCGRTNKDPDTCYSFWIGASLDAISSFNLIDFNLMKMFIQSAQHQVIGGIAKEPSNLPDILHTYMSLSALAIGGDENLMPLNPVLGITQRAAGKEWNDDLLNQLLKNE
ncbi:hypothetical protein CYY_009469 [Polysphondylium violaceum]|uniref:Geranylgeranyl transferase type-1 subunit beta n=1 Tax=Polysphondylium violaceum TaxID=133409 RepID=A0A8J4V0H3_9MYCE|nr:hypothetical protein CYY_009469 [Polysphondylium violaceum]